MAWHKILSSYVFSHFSLCFSDLWLLWSPPISITFTQSRTYTIILFRTTNFVTDQDISNNTNNNNNNTADIGKEVAWQLAQNVCYACEMNKSYSSQYFKIKQFSVVAFTFIWSIICGMQSLSCAVRPPLSLLIASNKIIEIIPPVFYFFFSFFCDLHLHSRLIYFTKYRLAWMPINELCPLQYGISHINR